MDFFSTTAILDPDILPKLIVVVHAINLFCLILLIRSGIQILYDHPKLYWTDNTEGDNHWLRFGKLQMPKDKLWTSLDEAEYVNSGIALPGGTHNLGAARHWHFTTAIVWLVTGVVYFGFLFGTGEWRRLIPTDIGIFSRAIDVLFAYLTLHTPSDVLAQPYNALQQLTYAGVVFVLTPLTIITGLAMSPALVARFPGFLKLFGNRRQVARSLHFLCMVGFILFALVHITIAMGLHFYTSVRMITLGHASANLSLAITVFVTAIFLIILFNIWITFFTLNHQIRLRAILTRFYAPIVRFIFGPLTSRQQYRKEDISPFFRVNGYPPKTPEYEELRDKEFRDWRLHVYGMVEQPLELSLDDLRALPAQKQITKHNCIQGWTAVAEWNGIHMKEIIKLCKPTAQAKYVIFRSFDKDPTGADYYSGLRVSDMHDPQTILAYEMNGKVLPLEYGAPLRLRCEQKYGYKMAKYIRSIEFVDTFENIGQGRGGYREDTVFFDWEASI